MRLFLAFLLLAAPASAHEPELLFELDWADIAAIVQEDGWSRDWCEEASERWARHKELDRRVGPLLAAGIGTALGATALLVGGGVTSGVTGDFEAGAPLFIAGGARAAGVSRSPPSAPPEPLRARPPP